MTCTRCGAPTVFKSRICAHCQRPDERQAKASERKAQCAHPPHRLYSWTAADGTRCVACCQCGTPLAGAA